MNKFLHYITDKKIAGIVIAVLALVIYLNTIPNKWTIDDGLVIHKNQSVQRGISGIPDIFTHDFMYGSLGKNTDAVSGGRYRPLTPAIYAIFSEILAKPMLDKNGKILKDKQGNTLNDLSANTTFPNIMHILNVIFYALLCWVLYQFLCLLFENYKSGLLLAFVATLIFTVHPLHTEAVANVKGSDEILSLLFSLLSATLVVKFAKKENYKEYILLGLASLCFLLGLLAKENSAMFLFIIPLTVWFFTKTKFSKLAVIILPLIISLFVYVGLRKNALGTLQFGQQSKMEMMNDHFLILEKNAKFAPLLQGSDVMVLQNPSYESIHKMPYSNQLATVFYTWGRYLKLLIAPYPLTYDYYPRHIEVKSFSDFSVIISVILNFGLLVFAILGIRKKKIYAYGILFYFITFSIVSNLFFPIGTNMGERFMFMPSVGICIALASFIVWIYEEKLKNFILSILGIIVVIFSVLTIKRNFNWKDNFTLMKHDLKISKNSAKIKSDYAEVVINKIGEDLLKAKKENRALTDEEKKEQKNLLLSTLPHLKQAVDIYPMYGLVWMNMARINQLLGNDETFSKEERLKFLQTSISAFKLTDTYKPMQYINDIKEFKSMSYASIGKLYGQSFNNIDLALENLQEAIKINPKNANAYFLMGTAYDFKGDKEKAFEYTVKAYQSEPKNRDYIENYALVLQKNPSKENLKKTEELLLEVKKLNASLSDENPEKKRLSTRTINLLMQNAVLQNDMQKLNLYQQELNKL